MKSCNYYLEIVYKDTIVIISALYILSRNIQDFTSGTFYQKMLNYARWTHLLDMKARFPYLIDNHVHLESYEIEIINTWSQRVITQAGHAFTDFVKAKVFNTGPNLTFKVLNSINFSLSFQICHCNCY